MGTKARKHSASRVLILGVGNFAMTLANEIIAHPHCGYQLVGMVAEDSATPAVSKKYPLLGSLNNLPEIIRTSKPDRIIVTLDGQHPFLYCHRLLEDKLFRHIGVDDGESLYEELTGKISLDTQTNRSLLCSGAFQLSRSCTILCTSLSFLFALIALIAHLPIMLLIALLIKIDSAGPVFFIQKRIGLGNREFNLLKFRTMHPSASANSVWAGDNADKITRVGRWLRKFRLDELPQFVNILRGDMNIVGPRPHPASNYAMYALVSRNTPTCGDQIPFYSLRTLVRPGITGWAQVKYRYANNLPEEIEKLRFDLYYIKHRSFWLDMQILMETVKVVVMGREGSQSNYSDNAAITAERA